MPAYISAEKQWEMKGGGFLFLFFFASKCGLGCGAFGCICPFYTEIYLNVYFLLYIKNSVADPVRVHNVYIHLHTDNPNHVSI